MLLSISLAQVYFLSSQFAEFIATVSGDEQQLAKAAVEAARKHVAQDCPNGNPYFPAAYCEKLQKLATSPDPTKYISGVVMPDKTFLTHAIGKKVVGGGFSGVAEVDVTSPIAKIVDSYRARIEFSAAPSPGGSSKAFAWLLVVLLPLGISLRILKTSLELFVDLR